VPDNASGQDWFCVMRDPVERKNVDCNSIRDERDPTFAVQGDVVANAATTKLLRVRKKRKSPRTPVVLHQPNFSVYDFGGKSAPQ
jgi:hypothetical protein